PWVASWVVSDWLEIGQEYWTDSKSVNEIQKQLKNFTVTKIEEKPKYKNPSAPFITSTLQMAAQKHLDLPPNKTMDIAQALYNAGLIT
ncbi:DNA topoisomerase, partial [Bacillus cereus]|uniref:DNA topoisomerase n=1 Tax=Bacillus cereus TaxID=1396 RepID=UPI0034D5E2B3